jgi:hypothetical protein
MECHHDRRGERPQCLYPAKGRRLSLCSGFDLNRCTSSSFRYDRFSRCCFLTGRLL